MLEKRIAMATKALRLQRRLRSFLGVFSGSVARWRNFSIMCLKLYVEEMSSEHQITMVSLDQLVSKNHQYRKFKSLFNFNAIEADLLSVESAGKL